MKYTLEQADALVRIMYAGAAGPPLRALHPRDWPEHPSHGWLTEEAEEDFFCGWWENSGRLCYWDTHRCEWINIAAQTEK